MYELSQAFSINKIVIKLNVICFLIDDELKMINVIRHWNNATHQLSYCIRKINCFFK